jgi:hypothetical protein
MFAARSKTPSWTSEPIILPPLISRIAPTPARYTHSKDLAPQQPKPVRLRVRSGARRSSGDPTVFASLRFIWNATSGHRLRPWRSEYVKWRIETYSGLKAEELQARDIFAFVWREKGNLWRYLRWTDRMDRWRKTGAGHDRGEANR